MCDDKGNFSELDETFRNNVKFGNNSTVFVMGKEKLTLQIKGDIIHNISNVLFVPNLKTNLLNVDQLQEKGYEIFIKNGVCRVQDEKLGLIAQSHDKCKPDQRIQVDCEDGDEVTGQRVENDEAIDIQEIPPVDCDSIAFEEAVKKPKWREAINIGIATIERNNTWELTELPKGQKDIDVKWGLVHAKKTVKENVLVNLTVTIYLYTGECKAEVAATRLPYFDWDYWLGAAEDMIYQLQ
ncbi:UNVERIFIED_CONTAM: Histone acetyltransferase HAC1 [Sesamum calycinum]|uniref:Histone acetyltransferase HAC1 n=1 Tax=Sesamum calycinum TaxID=2727403 RepID=A0AAW2KTU9_9LAMI